MTQHDHPALRPTKRLFEALLRTDFTTFAMRAHREIRPATQIMPNWHIDLVCHELTRCVKGLCKRLIINIPPGYLKSKLVNVSLPAYVLGLYPHLQILSASHNMDLSTVHSVDARLVMESAWYNRIFPRTRILRGDNQKRYFRTTKHGSRRACSMTGGVTGQDANWLIMDDPHDVDDALNVELLKGACQAFEHKHERRLRDPENDVIIIIMQRLHPEDLCGFLERRDGLEENGGLWRKVKLPMIATQDEAHEIGSGRYCRKEGDYLHPERDTPESVENTRATCHEFMWWGQYQQEPQPLSGSLVKKHWLTRYSEQPRSFSRVVASWDCAAKDGVTNSYSVCVVVGIHDNRAHVLHVWRERVTYPGLKAAFKAIVDAWKPTEILVEDKSTGQALIPDMRQEISSAFIHPVEPENDKLTRLFVHTPEFKAGRVLLPESAPWLNTYIDELTGFPLTAHDDQVDATSQALAHLFPKERNSAVQRARAGAV